MVRKMEGIYGMRFRLSIAVSADGIGLDHEVMHGYNYFI
jgi:hypothetical protein